jgi:hypothetical protein
MSAYLEYKKLWAVCIKDLLSSNTASVKGQILEAWLIMNSKIVPEIFNSLTSICGRNPYKIWERFKANYATTTIYGIYRVWQGS